jgi:hypothetical protein
MVRIAMGDTELLSHLGFEEDAFGIETAYVPFYVPCSDAIDSMRSLLKRLVNDLESGRAGFDSPGLELAEETMRSKISFKLFETETVKKYAMKAKATGKFDRLDPQDQVLRLCGSISDSTGSPVLLVIDELDVVGDTAGLASFIKSASSESLKFMLVGISQDVSKLVESHESLTRIAVPVKLPRMTDPEQAEIIENACIGLQLEGIDAEFDSQARRRIIELSNGFPWFVHVLGQEALVESYESAPTAGRIVVDRAVIDSAVNNLVFNRHLQEFRDRYQKAVRDSPQREYVLRALAGWRDGDVPTGEVYKVARELGVNNPSQYVKQLQQEQFGSVIERPPYQLRGMVRFKNAMFKNYVRIRDSIYEGVAAEVNAAWGRT